MKRPVLLTLLVFACIAFLPNATEAQDRRERRRQLVEDLLRTLVESGQESHEARDHRQYGPKSVELVVPQNKVKVTPQMVELRRHVGSLQSEADLLITSLRGQGGSVPQLRPLLADAIHIRAELDVFGIRCQKFPSIEPLRDEFLGLDNRWRKFNHQLRHVHALSPQCVTCLDKVHGHHQSACDVFGIQPQIDRQRLGQLATEMHADIKHLNRDLYYEFARHPQMQEMIRDGQQLQNQIVQYAPLIRRGNYDTIVSAYKQCQKSWRGFSTKVCRLPSERVRHDVARIEDLGHQFMEELWLTPELDHEYLGNTCSWVDDEMNKILGEITLADLLQCKNPATVLSAAKSFQSRCGTFAKCIDDKYAFDRLVPEYRLFEESWTEMDTQCRVLEKPEIVSRLDEIKVSITRFQPIFGSGPAISDDLMIRLAADWNQLSDQIHADVLKFDKKAYLGNTHRDLCNSCEKMSRKVRRLNQLVAKRSRKEYRKQLDGCFDQWKDVKVHLNKCPIDHRRKVAKARSQVEPLIVKLQLAYSDY